MSSAQTKTIEEMSNEELTELRDELYKSLDEAQNKQHELMMENQALNKVLSSINIPNMTTSNVEQKPAQTPAPASGVTPDKKQADKTTSMSVFGAAFANYLNNRTKRKSSINGTSFEDNKKQILDASAKIARGNVVKSLCKDTVAHLKVMQDPAASKEQVLEATKAVKDNIANIQQHVNAQLKGLSYLDKKGFDKAIKSLKSDAGEIAKMGKEMSESASVLNKRNDLLPDELKQNFHQLGDTAKNLAKTLSDTVTTLAAKLTPKAAGISIGG